METIREVLHQNERILQTSEPAMGVVSLADAGVRITLRPWCKAQDFWHVQYEVYRAILDRFRERQIETRYPVREVRLGRADEIDGRKGRG
jgi:small conductance mechanosensitive channel